MTRQFALQLLFALGVAAACALAATLLGAPLSAVLLALFGGAIGASILRAAAADQAPGLSPPVEEPERPRRPTVRDFIEAFREPVLIVRDRRIAIANAGAREVLGQHIENEDVRLAIRHPAAAERLIDPFVNTGANVDTELVGIGERERRWTMTVTRLADGARLVRLEDRSATFAAEQMRTDFVANASHELRTPLATLLGFIETLEGTSAGEEPETRARFLAIMYAEAKRIQRLVDDLISLSRIEAERFVLPREALDLVPILEEVRENQQFPARERGCRIVIDAPDDLPDVAGDRQQLVQLVDNLVANALKYGRANGKVTLRLALETPEMVRLTVKDEGEGIPKEHIPRVTERFYRVDPSRSRAMGGTGLGLSIVKHIVERHRGRLLVESVTGVGTQVHVLLPTEATLSSKGNDAQAGLARPRASTTAES